MTNICLMLVSSALLTFCYLEADRTLKQNGEWIASKTTLEMGVMGALKFMETRNALADGRLNLGAWHGYQEVVTKSEFSAARISFDIEFTPGSYGSFFVVAENGRRAGVRLSSHKDYRNIFFIADESGRFLEKRSLDLPLFAADRPGKVEIRIMPEKMAISHNGRTEEILAGSLPSNMKLGFRGSLASVYLDDVEVEDGAGRKVFGEDFQNHERLPWLFGSVFGGFLLLFVFFHRQFGADRVQAFRFLAFNVGVLMVSVSLVVAVKLSEERYPRITNDMRDDESYWKNATANRIREDILETSAQMDSAVPTVVFVGSSQTWGSGARTDDETFVKVFSRKVQSGYPCNVINAAYSGGLGADVIVHYAGLVDQVRPDVCVVNLSSNDRDEELFRRALEQLLKFNRERSIQTMFVLEANSPEYRHQQLPMHFVMKAVAEEFDLPVIDLHSYLTERADDGFIWWDMVHMTSFGHETAGAFLAESFLEVVDQ